MTKIRITTDNFVREGWESDQAIRNPVTNTTVTTQNSQYVTLELPPGNGQNPQFHRGAVCLNLTTQDNTATSILRRVRLRNNKQTHRLADITTLKFSTLIVNNINSSAPALVLQVRKSDDPNAQIENIFFDPRLQTGNNNGEVIPSQHPVLLNQWQEWDALAGGWAGQADANNPDPSLFTLHSYISVNPQALIANTIPGPNNQNAGGGIRFTVGGDSPDYRDFKGYIDAFIINKNEAPANANQPQDNPNRLLIYDFDYVHNHSDDQH